MIAIPAVFGVIGFALTMAWLTSSGAADRPQLHNGLIGLVILTLTALFILAPRKPRFTLTEQGVRVKDVLLPWSSIEDVSVTRQRANGFPIVTVVVLHHREDFTPPKLDLFYTFGRTSRPRKGGAWQTTLNLYSGAKGMNEEKLAKRIGEFLAAAHARDELAQLEMKQQSALKPDPAR